ncbi:hypothetical protein TNCV_1295931 [Trichonephila clavipes]|uniref:Uncharacterized protein n=1 Tax=Trichonephila clavipes TaxID=2585209 RepID=A0A8X6SRJ3_TRICX|nr:hypothetical protein TNCV_1295931 [Trichonephila clavipes]
MYWPEEDLYTSITCDRTLSCWNTILRMYCKRGRTLVSTTSVRSARYIGFQQFRQLLLFQKNGTTVPLRCNAVEVALMPDRSCERLRWDGIRMLVVLVTPHEVEFEAGDWREKCAGHLSVLPQNISVGERTLEAPPGKFGPCPKALGVEGPRRSWQVAASCNLRRPTRL